MAHQISLYDEIIVDNFAGGGGASTGIELALGRPVDIAINHDAAAVAMHQANHPFTEHFCESVWEVNPKELCRGRKIALMWLSPDCKHFSKAKGGKPVEKKIRGLAWVALRWASLPEENKPRIIVLENVEEFKTWGRIDPNTGKPDEKHKGETFMSFVNALKHNGYAVEWKELIAADYGAPTSRKRLVLIARCDGLPIVFPKATHAPAELAAKKGLKPYRTAAEIIDWSLSCPSIFNRKKPLVEATQRRIARGLDKFVIKNSKPFIVPIGYGGNYYGAGASVKEPLPTVTTVDHNNLAGVTLIQYHSETKEDEVRACKVDGQLPTVDTRDRYAIAAAHIQKYYGGYYEGGGSAADKPLDVVTVEERHAPTLAYMSHFYKGNGTAPASGAEEPMHTIMGKNKAAVIKVKLSTKRDDLGHWAEVRELLNKYAGYDLKKDEILLFNIGGTLYYISDIGMRMLTPRELYDAQGFPHDYQIEFDFNGKPYTKKEQVARCGNAVCPPMAEAVIRANMVDIAVKKPIKTMAELEKVMAA